MERYFVQGMAGLIENAGFGLVMKASEAQRVPAISSAREREHRGILMATLASTEEDSTSGKGTHVFG